MTERRDQPATAPTGWSRSRVGFAALGVVGALAIGMALWLATSDGMFSGAEANDPGPIHVHGLGVNPADGALFIATHSGLYRVARGDLTAQRVGDRRQDTMGFTVIGPNRFLGSGHPDLREAQEKNLPAHLGLIESDDAGRTWEPVSLLGEADFHVLRFVGESVYGYDSSNDRLLVSADRGRTWTELDKPGAIIDIAVDPRDGRHLVAAAASSSGEALYASRDGGGSWGRIGDTPALLAWSARGRLFAVGADGAVYLSRDGGRSLERRGEIAGEPAAFSVQAAEDLYVALHDGTIKRSTDGGATWVLRSTP